MAKIEFIREGINISVPEGTTILEAERQAGLVPDAPCGGTGKCGKCVVQIDGETVKACQTKAERDLIVDTTIRQRDYSILTTGYFRPTPFHPDLTVSTVQLKKAPIGEKKSEWERLTEQISGENSEPSGNAGAQFQPDPELASSLYDLRCTKEEWKVVHSANEILEVRREEGSLYFAAFDIGTTTVVGYLLNAKSGEEIAVESRLNPQSQYGADVIARSDYALAHGTDILSSCIRTAINEMLGSLAKDADADVRDIFQVSIVGNTCMHHLFLGISPGSLVHAPYTPAISQSLTLRASDYGLTIHPKGELLMLPNIAGYVGADTCGCLLTVRPDLKEERMLLLDIGTNGEMVMGDRNRLIACSTAAGPAFEGAKIECGMRGASGAVDHVAYQDGAWQYTTIEHVPAVGICGSGLIDLVACLLRAGYLDENGAWTKEAESSGYLQGDRFVLVPPQKAANDTGVYLSRKDIGEVQLAKGAIAAGIRILMEKLSITEEEIDTVYIAGAFGSYMDPASAGEIGIFPRSLVGKVKPIGNAAGEGAKIALVNSGERKAVDELARSVDFIELAGSPDFQDYFVDELEFEYD